MIEVFTDGACSGNPGPGGYGIIIKQHDTKEILRQVEGFPSTTNNRMEVTAACAALELLSEKYNVSDTEIVIYSDSKYLCDAHNAGWLSSWMKHGFCKPGGGRVKNVDLWERLLKAESGKNVKYVWVKGHNGHPENEECDRMAVDALMEFVRR